MSRSFSRVPGVMVGRHGFARRHQAVSKRHSLGIAWKGRHRPNTKERRLSRAARKRAVNAVQALLLPHGTPWPVAARRAKWRKARRPKTRVALPRFGAAAKSPMKAAASVLNRPPTSTPSMSGSVGDGPSRSDISIRCASPYACRGW